MSLVNRLFQQITGKTRTHRPRRRTAFSPFGIQAAQVQVLENRRLLSALTVTTAADSGAGSLRAEIAAANTGDTINFASSLKGQTIKLTSGELLINKGLTIQGPGAGQLTISAGNGRVFDVNSSQLVVLTGLTISNGLSTQGGGIFNAARSNLTVSDCTISNCHVSLTFGKGGGIFNAGTLTLTDSTLSGDVAGGFGGGGIYNTGTLTASGCTLSGDSATQGMGGGIYSAGGSADLTNCTLAGDFANGTSNSPGQGGGLYVGSGSASLTNCTVSLDRAAFGGGIAVARAPVNMTLVNTIVAGNTAGLRGADVFGSITTADHNLIGNGFGSSGLVNGVNGNIVGGLGNPVINAMLGPLQDNGGPTLTMALLADSPAIGTADNALAPVTDQRGVTRRDLSGETTDMGAYEL
jgi:hypothetical protein